MQETKINYDEEGDVLYISFGRSEHITGSGCCIVLFPKSNLDGR